MTVLFRSQISSEPEGYCCEDNVLRKTEQVSIQLNVDQIIDALIFIHPIKLYKIAVISSSN